ncbi:MAG: T9SS type A sorting domain-containing protein [Cyclobacteriaceae bacterium]
MKNQIILVSIMCFLLAQLMSAQSLPSGFEEWEEITVEQLAEPGDFWYSNNVQADSFFYGGGPVKKTLDSYSGDYAIRLETIIDYDGDTIPGYIGCFPEIWNGGILFTGNPDSLVGFYKCNIMPNDTADIHVNLTKDGSWEGSGLIEFTENDNADEYKRFAMKIDTNSNGQLPDTLTIVLGSAKNWEGAVPGTWIQFDSLCFKGTGLAQNDTLGNNSFERWADPNSYTYKNPLNWHTYNSYTEFMGDTSFVFESNDAHSGSSSLSLISDTVTGQLDKLGVISMLYNGDFAGDTPSGGLITNQWPDSVVAYCKYNPVGNDSAFVVVVNGNTDLNQEEPTPQNSNIKNLAATPSFERYVFDLTSIKTDTSDHDSVLIIISSSNIMAGSYEIGSQLWVDDIALYPQIVNAIQITSANGESEIYVDSTLQMHAEVFPDYALNDSVAWSVDDENIATIDDNGLLTGISSGTVTVKANSTDGTEVERTKNITVSEKSSIINLDINNTDISIYPIPAESVINIAFEKAMSGLIKLIDVSGKVLIETNISENKIKTIDVSGLQSGIYFIQLTINDNRINKKIIIR